MLYFEFFFCKNKWGNQKYLFFKINRFGTVALFRNVTQLFWKIWKPGIFVFPMNSVVSVRCCTLKYFFCKNKWGNQKYLFFKINRFRTVALFWNVTQLFWKIWKPGIFVFPMNSVVSERCCTLNFFFFCKNKWGNQKYLFSTTNRFEAVALLWDSYWIFWKKKN